MLVVAMLAIRRKSAPSTDETSRASIPTELDAFSISKKNALRERTRRYSFPLAAHARVCLDIRFRSKSHGQAGSPEPES